MLADAGLLAATGTGVALVRLPDWSYFVSAFTDPAEKLPNSPRAAGPPGNPNAAQILCR